MFSDPLALGFTVTTAAVVGSSTNFVRSGNDANQAFYRYQDGDMNDMIVKVAHSYGRSRNRFTIRADLNGIMPSAMTPSDNTLFSQSCYVVFDCPSTGPVVNTSTITNIDRRITNLIGQLVLGGVAADSTFLARVVKGGEL